jgi:PAS domain S-box-containing protein
LKSLLARLLLVVSIALVPALAFQIHTESQARHTRRLLVEDEAMRLVRLVSAEQQRIVEGAEQVLDVISGAPSVQDGMPQLCSRLLANLLEQAPRYNTAVVMGLDGHYVCAPGPFDRAADMSDRAYFQLALQKGGFAVGDYAVSRWSKQPTIHMAKPFRTRDGTVAGVVAVGLSIDWLGQQLSRLALPPGAVASVIDRNGTVLARYPDGARFVGQPLRAEFRFTPGSNGDRDAALECPEGHQVAVGYSPLDSDPKGWVVVVGLDRDLAFAGVAEANRTGMLLIVAGAALALATTYLAGTQLIRRPFGRLLTVAGRWRNGDLAARTGLRADGSEFGDLGGAFDGMAAAQEAREQVLRQSEELFRATFEQVAVGMAQVGMDGTWLRANDKLCAITGYVREELLTLTFADITHPDDLEADLAVRKALLAGEIATFTREKRYLHKGGGVVWVSLTVSLLRDSGGRPERILSVVEDITARKRMEAALQTNEARLRAVLEQIPAAVAILELPDGGVVIRSRHSAVLFGLPDAELAANPRAARRSAEHADGRPYAPGEYPSRRALCQGETVIAEPMLYRLNDGRLIDLEVYAAPVRDAAGTVIAAVAAAFDVSERKRTEALLARSHADLEVRVREEVSAREAAQMRAAHAERMQALGQLAGGIAHDFNNVLQAVMGAARLIERHPGEEAGVRRLARLAVEASERGASTTRRLLAFGHLADLRAEPMDVAALLGDLQEILAHTLGAAIDVSATVGAGVPLVLADKAQLETALVNLATNARDAMPGGGRLTFSAGAETLGDGTAHRSGLAPGRYVRLAVADTGAGMDPATLARAGDPFFTTKALGAGTGLGLPMAKGFIEQSGGALSIDSHPGSGTTVTLWLPEARSGTARITAAPRGGGLAETAHGTPGTSSTRVLLADDEDLVREVLAEHLEDAGYSVLAAPNGTEALALLAAGEAVDILVTDLAMPGLDGLAVIRAAQERRPGLPAVLLTGYAGDGAALAVGGAVTGRFSLLRKPVSGDHLVDRVRALLAGRPETGC